MKKQVSKSVRKAAIRFALLLVQLVKVDGNIDAWEERYRKTWGRRKVDALLGDAQNVLDAFVKRLAGGRKLVDEIEKVRWSGPVDRPWNFDARTNWRELTRLGGLCTFIKICARQRFGAGSFLAGLVEDYANYRFERADAYRLEYEASNPNWEWEAAPVESAPVESVAPVESAPQAFDFIINADGSFSMEKTRDASDSSGFIVERRAAPVEVVDNASNDTEDAFKSSVKTIIISSALGRFSNVIDRLQSSKTSPELIAAVLDACREVQSVEGWERYKEASIIDDEAERFTNELKASCDDAEKFPRLQAIAEKIAAAFGSFAIKALAAA